jgi:predicted phosphodiesterase
VRLAVISDIHGNAVALNRVILDLETTGVDQVVCLGDAIQSGPQPAETVGLLRNLGCPVVMGNADAWLLTGEDSGHEDISAARRSKMEVVRAWSLAQLSPDDKAFIAAFQPTVAIELEPGRNLLGYHGSPASFDDFILPDTPEAEFQAMLSRHVPHIMAGGHVHLQFIRHLGRTFHFNPGSVGVAYRHGQTEEGFRLDPWAEYAVITAEGGRLGLEFRRVAVEVCDLAAACRASGRPFAADWIAQYS